MTKPTFALAQASGEETAAVIEDCLRQLEGASADATLGLFYVNDALSGELGDIAARLIAGTGVEHWLGTVGFGVIASGHEYYDQPALAVLLTDIDGQDYTMLPGLTSDAVGELPAGLPERIEADGAALAILHGDPSAPATPGLIGQLGEGVPGLFSVGGLSGSQGAQLQYADGLTEGGLSGVVFSARVPVAVNHTQGCTPIGPRHTVTRAQRNVIATLDDRSALDVLKEDVGEVLSRDLQRMGGYIFTGMVIPGSDTGDYMIRQLVGIDPDNGLLAIGDMVDEGRQLMFCRRDGNSALEDLRRMLDELKQRIGSTPIRGGLYHTCTGRGRYQFGDQSEEARAIHEALGDFPLIGFFANGEIYNNRLYGFTGVLTLFLDE